MGSFLGRGPFPGTRIESAAAKEATSWLLEPHSWSAPSARVRTSGTIVASVLAHFDAWTRTQPVAARMCICGVSTQRACRARAKDPAVRTIIATVLPACLPAHHYARRCPLALVTRLTQLRAPSRPTPHRHPRALQGGGAGAYTKRPPPSARRSTLEELVRSAPAARGLPNPPIARLTPPRLCPPPASLPHRKKEVVFHHVLLGTHPAAVSFAPSPPGNPRAMPGSGGAGASHEDRPPSLDSSTVTHDRRVRCVVVHSNINKIDAGLYQNC